MTKRIHITGASGSGTTTLGAHLALAIDAPHHDTDSYFWLPTDPPYRDKRVVPERLALMEQLFVPQERWVLSGSCAGWGDDLIPYFDLVVLLAIPSDTRMQRLRRRERHHYGDRIAPGGDMAAAHTEFMDWAAQYDDADFTSRSRHRHLAWCETLPCPVLHLDSTAPVANLVAAILRKL